LLALPQRRVEILTISVPNSTSTVAKV